MSRKIIHVDMDCFFAAVEMKKNPRLKNVPIAIGGSPKKRGVISTCNYEARKYGVKSALASAFALRLCPDLLILPHDMQAYKEASNKIHEIFYRYTDLVEPISVDEAFLDVTNCPLFHGSATLIAQDIKQTIFKETGLIASAGVAPNKFLAKIASDWKKPDGLFSITPYQIDDFVKRLEVGKIWGVGKVTEQRLHSMGIYTCGDIQKQNPDKFAKQFGKPGWALYQLAFGIDHRPVEVSYERKSLSNETTYPKDLELLDDCLEKLPFLLSEMNRRLQKWKKNHPCTIIQKISIKIKFSDFKSVTVERIKPLSFFDQLWRNGVVNQEVRDAFEELMIQGYQKKEMPVRLLGVGLKFMKDSEFVQLELPFRDERLAA